MHQRKNLDAITDRRSSQILTSISSAEPNTDILITQLNLTRKQYYSRMSSLIKAGLVKRQKGRYLLTAFGKVIYSAQIDLETKIENALDNYWKLKAIDSMETCSRQERNNVISELIDNEEIKTALIEEELQLSMQPVSNRNQDVKDTLLRCNAGNVLSHEK